MNKENDELKIKCKLTCKQNESARADLDIPADAKEINAEEFKKILEQAPEVKCDGNSIGSAD